MNSFILHSQDPLLVMALAFAVLVFLVYVIKAVKQKRDINMVALGAVFAVVVMQSGRLLSEMSTITHILYFIGIVLGMTSGFSVCHMRYQRENQPRLDGNSKTRTQTGNQR